jgi:hypothetical protein
MVKVDLKVMNVPVPGGKCNARHVTRHPSLIYRTNSLPLRFPSLQFPLNATPHLSTSSSTDDIVYLIQAPDHIPRVASRRGRHGLLRRTDERVGEDKNPSGVPVRDSTLPEILSCTSRQETRRVARALPLASSILAFCASSWRDAGLDWT